MEWAQFGILILTIAGLFFWNRTSSKTQTKQLRREMIEVVRDIKEEYRDFRARLSSIEEIIKNLDRS